MKNKEVYIHIGVGKTGTTTLQNNIFNQLPDVACLGRPNHLYQVYKDFIYGVRLAEDFEVDGYTQAFVNSVLESNFSKVIISDESFAFDVSSLVARRLKKIFPNAKILITIRDQKTAVISRYSGHEYFLKGTPVDNRVKFISFDEYFNFHIKNHNNGYFRYIKYGQLAKSYSDYFGKENVNILLFEEMAKQPDQFCQKLGSFLQVSGDDLFELLDKGPKQRKSDTSAQHSYSRLRSYLPVKTLKNYVPFANEMIGFLNRNLKSGKKANISLTDNQIELLHALYAKDNAALNSTYNLNLEGYGYLGFTER